MAKADAVSTPSPIKMRADLHDVNSDAWHLYDLIDVTSSMLIEEGTFVRPDGERDRALDQVSSLLWIARDMCKQLATDTDNLFKPAEVQP